MKKIILTTMTMIVILSMTLVSCQKEVSGKHHYTPEELAELHRQDSLRNIIPADWIFTQKIFLPYSENWEGVTAKLVLNKDTTKLLDFFDYTNVSEFVAGLGTLTSGAQVGNDIVFYAYQMSTKYEYDSPSSTNYFGHWFDANGDAVTWGNGQVVYCEKQDETTLNFTIGHLPGGVAIGDTLWFCEAVKDKDTTQVAFLFEVIIADEIPEVYPVTTVVGTQTYNFSAAQDNNYATTSVAIDAAAITTAIGIAPGDAEIYGIDASDDSLYIHGSTADDPGYWFTATGDVCSWGNAGCALFADYIIADTKFNIGQFPDGTTVGSTYTVKIAFVNLDNLKQYNVVLNLTVTAPALVYPETTLVTTLNLPFSVPIQPTEWVDNTVALDSASIQTAIGCGPSAADLYGVFASDDSLYIKGSTANNGYFFTSAGEVCTYGNADASIYVEYRPGAQLIGVGQYPGRCVSGTTYYGTLAFVNGDKQANVKVALTIQ
jgi:hypothetical protein